MKIFFFLRILTILDVDSGYRSALIEGSHSGKINAKQVCAGSIFSTAHEAIFPVSAGLRAGAN